MTRPNRAWRTAMVLTTASLALTACGGSNSSNNASSDNSSSAAPSSSAPAAKGDGDLTVGTLLPQTGDLAFLGPPEFAGVQTAVDDINAAGGVLGKPVVQIKADSGDGTPDIAGAQTDKLLDANADVIVGAASSSVSLSVIDKITGAGVVQFSPANTSPAFDDPKTDPKNLYFRTAPSDVLQGAVMAQPGDRGRQEQRRDPGPPGLLRRGARRADREGHQGGRRQRRRQEALLRRRARTSPPRSTRSPRRSPTPSCWSPSTRPRRSSRS